MRSKSQIERKLRQRRFRHQKRYIDSLICKSHVNCRFNVIVDGLGDENDVFVCAHPDCVSVRTVEVEHPASHKVKVIKVCDSRLGEDRSDSCDLFESRKSVDELKDEFRKILGSSSSDMDRFSKAWPDMAQLVWVLHPADHEEVGDQDVEEVEPDQEGDVEEEGPDHEGDG